MKCRLTTTAIAVATVFPLVVPIAVAQDSRLDAVVVTATRTTHEISESLASATVFTRADIERLQPRSMMDLLKGAAGLSLANNGGLGKNTSVFLRGAESDHVLVLIDGIKVGSATTGAAALQEIPIELVERIEIVRGPRSGLYGADAIGGVIQIFTRRGQGALTPYFSVGGGSDKTRQGSAGLSGGNDQGWFSASVSAFETDGFDSCSTPPGVFAGCFADEPDRDGYRNLGGSLRGGVYLPGGGTLELSWLRSDNDNDFDGTFQNESESTQDVLGGRLSFSPVDRWDMTLSAGLSRDHSKNFKDGVFSSRFETDRRTVSLQNDVQVTDGGLATFGYDYLKDEISSDTAFVVRSRDNHGVFAQYLAQIGKQQWQIGARSDDNEQFGRNNTGSIAWGYAFGPELQLFASYGTAFKAPTFNELYFPGFGNPDLDPERAKSFELGLSGRTGWGGWSASVYRMQVDDLIAFDSALSLPNNIQSARLTGLEAEIDGRLFGWDMRAALTLLDPQNRSEGANRGNLLPRRAQQSVRLDADRSFDAFSVGASYVAQGRRYDDVANTRRLGGFGTVDLRAEYAIDPDWRIQLRLENLFDKDYETAAFFNQQGRALFFTLRYQPSR